MADFYPMKKAKSEVNSSIRIWSRILQNHLGNKIEYAYVKGSSVKRWDSPIDYVPVLSDVDIHLKLMEGFSLFEENAEQFDQGLAISAEYEERFLNENPDPLHIPRVQVIAINRHLTDPDFVLPQHVEDQNVLIGKIGSWTVGPPEEVKAVDLHNLLKLREVLAPLPESVIDRVGIDLIALIRRLCYEVSPAPVRLLSQFEENPYRVWDLNRTAIYAELKERGYPDLAENYRSYYQTGWEVFNSRFLDGKAMRKLLKRAYSVLELSTRYSTKH
jgi:hypothetical protein